MFGVSSGSEEEFERAADTALSSSQEVTPKKRDYAFYKCVPMHFNE